MTESPMPAPYAAPTTAAVGRRTDGAASTRARPRDTATLVCPLGQVGGRPGGIPCGRRGSTCFKSSADPIEQATETTDAAARAKLRRASPTATIATSATAVEPTSI